MARTTWTNYSDNWTNNFENWTNYFEKQAQLEDDMCFRHPWFNLFYNWLIAALIVALFVSFIGWGLDIRTRRMANEMTERALASWQAEVQDESARSSQEYVLDREATAVAKAFYGIRLFIEKYDYSESDLATYARCMFNRADSEDLIRVISAPNQFTGYSDGNQVLAEYKQLALRLVEEWHTEDARPVDISYRFAELTPQGIFLKDDLHADGRRWHA